MEPIVIVALLVILASILYLVLSSARANLPPGPPCLPIVGGRPFVKWPIWRWGLSKRDQYPDIYCYKDVENWIVVLNSYKAIHAAFVGQANDFVGRERDPILGDKWNFTGISLNDGPHWRTHRRLALQSLRDMGFAKAHSQELIREEALSLVEEIEAAKGEPISTEYMLMAATANVVSHITFGERLDESESEFLLSLIKFLDSFSHADVSSSTIVSLILPIFRKLPAIGSCIPEIRAYSKTWDVMLGLIQKRIDKHVGSFDALNPPRDFIDDYLLQQQTADPKTREEILTDEHLLNVLLDLFLASTGTTAVSLMWCLLWMAANIDAQKEVQDELDKQLESSGGIQMSDRQKLPLVEAFLEETHRFCTLFPTSVARRTQSSFKFLGYDIPANALIYPNLMAAHFDEELFPDAHVFKPRRFIIDGKFTPISQIIPFSLGKRSCLGESLARMELFLVFSVLMKHFHVSLDPKDKFRQDEIFHGTDGQVRAPQPHKLVFTVRN